MVCVKQIGQYGIPLSASLNKKKGRKVIIVTNEDIKKIREMG